MLNGFLASLVCAIIQNKFFAVSTVFFSFYSFVQFWSVFFHIFYSFLQGLEMVGDFGAGDLGGLTVLVAVHGLRNGACQTHWQTAAGHQDLRQWL